MQKGGRNPNGRPRRRLQAKRQPATRPRFVHRHRERGGGGIKKILERKRKIYPINAPPSADERKVASALLGRETGERRRLEGRRAAVQGPNNRMGEDEEAAEAKRTLAMWRRESETTGKGFPMVMASIELCRKIET